MSITVVFLPAEDRQTAENAMRERNTLAVTAATLTLELGIDIGYLERVIQLESPLSVASFYKDWKEVADGESLRICILFV